MAQRSVYGVETDLAVSRLVCADGVQVGDPTPAIDLQSAAFVVRGGLAVGVNVLVGDGDSAFGTPGGAGTVTFLSTAAFGTLLGSGPTTVDTSAGAFSVTGGGNVAVAVGGSLTLDASGGVAIGGPNSVCTINGSLEVRGTMTAVESLRFVLHDNTIELAAVQPDDAAYPPTRAAATGGGVVLRTGAGPGDPAFLWRASEDPANDTPADARADAWLASDDLGLAAGKMLRVDVLGGKGTATGLALTDGAATLLTLRGGLVGVGTIGPVVTLDVVGSDAMRVPVGGTGDRPSVLVQDVGMVRYNNDTTRHRFEVLQMMGGGSLGQQQWVAAGVCNAENTAFVSVYDDADGSSLDEIRFVTSASYTATGELVSGVAAKVDAQGYFGIGMGANSLGSPLEVWGEGSQQVVVRHDADNSLTLSVDAGGNATLQAHSGSPATSGDIHITPAGPTRQVIVGGTTSGNVVMTVNGYLSVLNGLRFSDGSVQTLSAQQSGGANPVTFGQWYLGTNTNTTYRTYSLPDATSRVAVGVSDQAGVEGAAALAKLSVCHDAGDGTGLSLLQLVAGSNAYATFDVNSTGALTIQTGSQYVSDILLQPQGNVGIGVDVPLASLHVDNDLFLQAFTGATNTSTGTGLYFRHDGTDGRIASGNLATGSLSPLLLQSSAVGIATSTPAATLSVGGNLSIGSTFASTYGPPADGLLVQGAVCVGTSGGDGILTVASGGAPALSLEQAAPAGPFMHITGYSAAGTTTGSLVVDDGSVQAARIKGFAQVQVTDLSGTLAGLEPGSYWIPLYRF